MIDYLMIDKETNWYIANVYSVVGKQILTFALQAENEGVAKVKSYKKCEKLFDYKKNQIFIRLEEA